MVVVPSDDGVILFAAKEGKRKAIGKKKGSAISRSLFFW
jgi:hypothetical protein